MDNTEEYSRNAQCSMTNGSKNVDQFGNTNNDEVQVIREVIHSKRMKKRWIQRNVQNVNESNNSKSSEQSGSIASFPCNFKPFPRDGQLTARIKEMNREKRRIDREEWRPFDSDDEEDPKMKPIRCSSNFNEFKFSKRSKGPKLTHRFKHKK